MKKILLLIGTISAMIISSSSCSKDEDKDAAQCGGDSCLVAECKNHPAGSWVWEHCYDYTTYPKSRPSNVRKFFRHNKEQMDKNCAIGKALYGTLVREIKHEYDIWNRTNNVEVLK